MTLGKAPGAKMDTVFRYYESRETTHHHVLPGVEIRCFCFDCTDTVARKCTVFIICVSGRSVLTRTLVTRIDFNTPKILIFWEQTTKCISCVERRASAKPSSGPSGGSTSPFGNQRRSACSQNVRLKRREAGNLSFNRPTYPSYI